MLSQEDRLRRAKMDMDALRRMESPYARVLMSSGNVVLPNKEERTNIELSTPNYYPTGPHFISYTPNRSFTIN
jgi:hypothetical protein